MDKNGVDVYKQAVDIIESAMQQGLSGVTLIQLSRDKICFVNKTEYQDVLNYAMNFFLEKEEYLECAKIRDIKESLKVRGMFDPPVRKFKKSLI
jgi:hypothetical protein